MGHRNKAIVNDIDIMIAGKAGDGSLVSGEILAKIFARMGLNVCTIKDFPSNIRGLPTNYIIRGGKNIFLSKKNYIDFLIALDEISVIQNINELAHNGVLIYDNSSKDLPKNPKRKGINIYLAPIEKMAVQNLGGSAGRKFKNLIVLGILGKLIGLDENEIQITIKDLFGRKGQKVVEKNIEAYKMGIDFVSNNLKKTDSYIIKKLKKKHNIILTGDEAIGLGALVAGCRFYAGYPISPVTEIMEWAASNFPRYNGVVVQTEDELSAILMVIGASYCGARAMTSTSGPGSSLMTESLSLAGITETPVVLVHGQRGGPGTGLPTKSEQSDIEHVLYSSHGDFPRIIISPGTIEEAFLFIGKAFNLAEQYQCPVILLSEQMLCQNKCTIKKLDSKKVKINRGKLLSQSELDNIQDYKRYKFTNDGISPRTIPSMKNGLFEANSNEHDEYGGITEDTIIRKKMMLKRLNKIEIIKKYLIQPKEFGKKNSTIGIIGIGSTYGVIRTSMNLLDKENINSKYLQIRMLQPFPFKSVKKFVDSCSKVYIVEQNATRQLTRYILANLGISEKNKKIESVLRYDGLAFKPMEIMNRIKKGLKNE